MPAKSRRWPRTVGETKRTSISTSSVTVVRRIGDTSSVSRRLTNCLDLGPGRLDAPPSTSSPARFALSRASSGLSSYNSLTSWTIASRARRRRNVTPRGGRESTAVLRPVLTAATMGHHLLVRKGKSVMQIVRFQLSSSIRSRPTSSTRRASGLLPVSGSQMTATSQLTRSSTRSESSSGSSVQSSSASTSGISGAGSNPSVNEAPSCADQAPSGASKECCSSSEASSYSLL
jgi:hypothetical protein